MRNGRFDGVVGRLAGQYGIEPQWYLRRVGFVVHGLFFLFGVAGISGHSRGLLSHFYFFVVVWLAFNCNSDNGAGSSSSWLWRLWYVMIMVVADGDMKGRMRAWRVVIIPTWKLRRAIPRLFLSFLLFPLFCALTRLTIP